jgi:hypothetical protein
MRSPRAELPIRTRAAPGPRSTGKKTGPHGACLTQGVVRRTGKTPRAPCFEETRFWSRAIGAIADGECRGEAPEGGRALEVARSRALRGNGCHAPFGASPPFCEAGFF